MPIAKNYRLYHACPPLYHLFRLFQAYSESKPPLPPIILDRHQCHWAHPNCHTSPSERPTKRPRLGSRSSMDLPASSSNQHESRPLPSTHLSRIAVPPAGGEGSSSGRSRTGIRPEINGPLRRGHSDGDVIDPRLEGQKDQETWMDFLRESSRLTDDGGNSSQGHSTRSFNVPDMGPRQEEHEAAMKRAALMLADRKRRLMDNREDYARRRSASNLSYGSAMVTQRSGQTHGYRPRLSFGAPQRSGGHADYLSVDRPVPRQSLGPDSHSRQGREITLPRWQPDSEVASCPICGTSFSFWFRKHHCRKCGRVVCANCSPHRITIPRQFIVQPPQDANRTSSMEIAAGIEVVDLTEDQDIDAFDSQQNSSNLDTPQSPVLRIDPALGGGQEVRLCNPCVPDPNPLPHLPFEPPTRLSIHSFSRPDVDRPRTAGNHSQRSSLNIPQRASSISQSFHQSDRSSSHSNNEPSSQGDRRNSTSQQSATQPGWVRQFRDVQGNHPTAYGSVPDRSTHNVSLLLALVHCHWNHQILIVQILRGTLIPLSRLCTSVTAIMRPLPLFPTLATAPSPI